MVLLEPPAPAARVLLGRTLASFSFWSAAARRRMAVRAPPGTEAGDRGRLMAAPEAAPEDAPVGDEARGEDCPGVSRAWKGARDGCAAASAWAALGRMDVPLWGEEWMGGGGVGVVVWMAGLMGGRKGTSMRCLLFGVSREVVREAGVAVHKPAPESDVDPCAGIEATVPMPGKFRRNYIVPTPGFGPVQMVNVGRAFWTPAPQIWRHRSRGTHVMTLDGLKAASHVPFALSSVFLFKIRHHSGKRVVCSG